MRGPPGCVDRRAPVPVRLGRWRSSRSVAGLRTPPTTRVPLRWRWRSKALRSSSRSRQNCSRRRERVGNRRRPAICAPRARWGGLGWRVRGEHRTSRPGSCRCSTGSSRTFSRVTPKGMRDNPASNAPCRRELVFARAAAARSSPLPRDGGRRLRRRPARGVARDWPGSGVDPGESREDEREDHGLE